MRINELVNKKNISVVLIILAVVIIGFWWRQGNQQTSKLDDFTKCLKDRGAKFYGAFWCPHCQNQKAIFGSSAKYLPYIECSTPDGNSQLPVCKDKNIEGYPTWEFNDGSRITGEISLDQLAQKTECQLPN